MYFWAARAVGRPPVRGSNKRGNSYMYIYFQWTPGVEEYVRITEGAAANKVGKEIEYVYYYTLELFRPQTETPLC